MTRPGRIACLVPHCRRTAAEDHHPGCTEIVCRRHWHALAKAKRRVYTRAWREARRALARQIMPGHYATAADLAAAQRARARCARLWRAFRRQVIEAAAEIGGAP